MSEIVIYTAIFGGYDRLKPPRRSGLSCDFVCFTDDPLLQSDSWNIRYVDLNAESRSLWNRHFKMLPHRYFPEYERSVYIDGNIQVLRNPQPLIDRALSNRKIAMPPHPDRDCVYKELKLCADLGLITEKEALRRTAVYKQARFPHRFGLFENNVIIREHNDPTIIRLMEAWWDDVREHGIRDQCNLAFLAWWQGVEIEPILEGPRTSRRYFKIGIHETDRQHSLSRSIARYVRANRHINSLYAVMNHVIDTVLYLRSGYRSVRAKRL